MSVCVVVIVLTSTFRCPEVGLEFFTFRCPEVRFDFSFLGVQRLNWNLTFRCPEVGLEFSLLGVQRLD